MSTPLVTPHEKQLARIVKKNLERDLRVQVAREVTEFVLAAHPEITTTGDVVFTVSVLEGLWLAVQMVGGHDLAASVVRS